MIKPYDWQEELMDSSYHLRVVVGSRKIGKTTACSLVSHLYKDVLWLGANYSMLSYAQDIVGNKIDVMFCNYNILDIGEIKGRVFNLIIIDELYSLSIENTIRVLKILWRLWRMYPQADWLVTGTPRAITVPFPTEIKIPQPLKVFRNLSEEFGKTWHILSDDTSLMELMPERVYRQELLAEFLE